MVSGGPPTQPVGNTPARLLFSSPRIFVRFWRVSVWALAVDTMVRASQRTKHQPRFMGAIVSKRTVEGKHDRRRRRLPRNGQAGRADSMFLLAIIRHRSGPD